MDIPLDISKGEFIKYIFIVRKDNKKEKTFMNQAINSKYIGLIILSLFIIINGCTGTPRLMIVGENFDPTDDYNDYQSILILRTIIVDKTGSKESIVLPIRYNVDCGRFWINDTIIHNPNTPCDRKLYSQEECDKRTKYFASSVVDKGWYEKDGIRYFNEATISKIIPSKCEINFIHLLFRKGAYERYLTLDINRAYQFESKKLYYLGVIRIDLNEKEGSKYSYNLNIFYDEKIFQYDINLFKKRYPKLYDYYKDNIVKIPSHK